MVVTGAEGGEVPETVKSDGVLWGGETESSGISCNGTRGHVVRGLTTDKEAVPTDNGIGGKGGTLEEVCSSSSVERGLLVDGSEDGSFLSLSWVESSGKVEFETLGDDVVDLDLSSEEVGSGPSLGK